MRAWDGRICDRSQAFWPLRCAAAAFSPYADWPDVSDYAAAFRHEAPVRFEAALPKPRRGPRWRGDPAERYDGLIHLHRRVPTRRRNWHDFFNALVWATFPRAKWRLHERQYRAACDPRLAPRRRSSEQDALTLLDEGGILLVCQEAHEPTARTALAERADDAIADLVASGAALLLIFGHALYDHLTASRAPVRGMVALVALAALPVGGARIIERADAGLANLLAERHTFRAPRGHGSLPLELLAQRGLPAPG